MASSQVEIASSSPFGCVLRDRNHRDGCRESNVKATHAALQRNIKNFVMDHLNTCMSMSSDAPTNENENNAGSWVSNASKNNNNNNNNNLRHLRFTRNNHGSNNNNNKKDESSLASLISPRHSRLLDRWAARQARAMVSTLENEVELFAVDDNNNNDNNKVLGRSCSSTSDDTSSEISNLGASSLVQIWEKRLNQCNGSKPNTPVSNGRTSPNAVVTNNNPDSEAGESCYAGNEDSSSFPDWESHSDQSLSPQGRRSSSETAEGDRVCVADIIKRLTSPNHQEADNDHEGYGSSLTSSPCRDFAPENSEHRAFPQATCSPRIRGRRAFNDLLMQFERDRHGELNHLAECRAVSRFTQRGRIQSLLRLKLLQRGMAAANDQSRQKSTSSRDNKQPQESAIMQLRERFSTAVEHRTTVQAEVANPTSSRTEIVNNTIPLDNSSATNQTSKDTCSQTVHGTANYPAESTQISISQTNVDHNEGKAHPSSQVTVQETCLEVQHDDSQETAEATPSMTDSNLNVIANKAETSNQQYAMVETTYEGTVEEGEARDQHYAEGSYDDMVEEEVEAMDQNYDEISYDWISEISRPRSYWEERRQAWYREMLDTASQNEDIRILLERRTVSTFLSSDFRVIMDRLMKSHRGTQTQLVNCQDDEEDNQGLIAILQECMRSASTPQEDGHARGEEEERDERRNEEQVEEEEESLEEQEQCHEVGGYFHQPSSPSPSRTWSFRDNEASDDFDRVASTSSPSQPSQSQSSYQDNRRCSSPPNHHSIEMELIYDLRGQMEQLYHEMSELRKSIKSCMDMQMQLQQSMNQEVHTVKNEEKHNRAPKKGNCCICYDMKVDSLLYRCGHMCACLKCANELQWNGGKCPICRAKIVDVVRVYVDA